DPLRLDSVAVGEADAGRFADFASRRIHLAALAERALQVFLPRDVDHETADRRVEGIRVQRYEHGAVLGAAPIFDLAQNRVGEVPPEVDAGRRVVQIVRRGRHHARGPGVAQGYRSPDAAGR